MTASPLIDATPTDRKTPVDLSVIVASYNTADLTLQCIRAVLEQTKSVALEVIVVDDCSPDDSVRRIREAFPGITVLENETNRRYAFTNNRGLAACSGRYGLILNSDTIVLDDALGKLVRFMDEHPDVGAAGPKLLNPDGTIQHCVRSFVGVPTALAQSVGLHRIWPNNPVTNRYYHQDMDYAQSQVVDAIGTTAFIIRRSIWERFGMLDERFSWAWVDPAYCHHLKEHGQNVWYVAEAEVIHLGSQSINTQSTAKELRLQHEALRLYYDLHLGKNDSPLRKLILHQGIRMRHVVKRVALAFARDKRLIKGPGAPKLSNTLGPARARAALGDWQRLNAPATASATSSSDVGIITVLFNSAPYLDDFVASLRVQPGAHRVYVIDNASTDGCFERFRELIAESAIEVWGCRNPENAGIAVANNQGIDRAIGDGCERVLFLNNDVSFDPGLIGALAASCTADVAATPRIVDGERKPWFEGGAIRWALAIKAEHRTTRSADPVTYAPTCCLMVHRESLARAGHMNERYFVYGDDVDFAIRLVKARVRFVVVDTEVLVHKVGSTTGGSFSEFSSFHVTRGRVLTLRLHTPKALRPFAIAGFGAWTATTCLRPTRRPTWRSVARGFHAGLSA